MELKKITGFYSDRVEMQTLLPLRDAALERGYGFSLSDELDCVVKTAKEDLARTVGHLAKYHSALRNESLGRREFFFPYLGGSAGRIMDIIDDALSGKPREDNLLHSRCAAS